MMIRLESHATDPNTATLLDLLADADPRFAAKIAVRSDGCWIYSGAISAAGYGNVRRGSKNIGAHRYAWVLAGRELVPGLVLDHICGTRPCVNVTHLDQTSQWANVLRSESTASTNRAKTACPSGHPLIGENVYEWRGTRRCRTCNTEAQRRRRAGLSDDTASRNSGKPSRCYRLVGAA